MWLTGLSGAGKTTIAAAVSEELRRRGLAAVVLDGDCVRERIGRELGFNKEGRDENVRRIGYLAELLTSVGVIVIVAAISPYRQVRTEVRQRLGGFLEVYVNASLQVCRSRDPKGIYRRAFSGELRHVSGVDDPYEPPIYPDIECRTASEAVAQSASKVVDAITAWLAAPSLAAPPHETAPVPSSPAVRRSGRRHDADDYGGLDGSNSPLGTNMLARAEKIEVLEKPAGSKPYDGGENSAEVKAQPD